MKKIVICIFILLLFPAVFASSYDLNSYNNVLYVSNSGNDTTGDGTISNPYATVNRAVNLASSGDAVYITSGEYDVTNDRSTSSYAASGLDNFGKNIDFIGEAGETTLTINVDVTATARDVHFYAGNGFSKIYNMIFIRDSRGRTANYSNAFFGNPYAMVQGEIYNSVFKTLNCSSPALTYYNSGQVHVKVYNSVFELEHNMVDCYTGDSSNTQIINSINNYSFYNDSNYYSNNLENASFDENYNVLTSGWEDTGLGLDVDGSQADLGVYGGLDAWNLTSRAGIIPEISNIILLSIGLLSLLYAKRIL